MIFVGLIAHTSASEISQSLNVLIVLLSVIKTFDNCVISKADVWAIIIPRPLNPRNRLKIPISLGNGKLLFPYPPIPRELFPVGELASSITPKDSIRTLKPIIIFFLSIAWSWPVFVTYEKFWPKEKFSNFFISMKPPHKSIICDHMVIRPWLLYWRRNKNGKK